jgi:hypothetical protein
MLIKLNRISVNVDHIEHNKIHRYMTQNIINPENVKRWYQLLVGKGEEAMYKDIEATLPTIEEISAQSILQSSKTTGVQAISQVYFRKGVNWVIEQLKPTTVLWHYHQK